MGRKSQANINDDITARLGGNLENSPNTIGIHPNIIIGTSNVISIKSCQPSHVSKVVNYFCQTD
jgi:hypothetical protein